MSLIVSTERCFYCSRFFHPSEMLLIGESVRMCQQCREKHDKQVEGFIAPDACALCGTSTEALTAANGQLRMFVHWIDGSYQLLCVACDAQYFQKRKDLYRHTRFGAARKI